MLQHIKHIKRHILSLLGLFSIMAFLFSGTTLALADSDAHFGIRPADPSASTAKSGYFIFKGEAGKPLKDAVTIANSSNIPIKVQVYPVDATTGQQSGAVYLNVTDPRQGVGSWITLENPQIEIAANKQATIPFTINIPAQTKAGQYLGGIAVQLVEETKPTPAAVAGFGITSLTRALTAVLINVGDNGQPSLQINNAQLSQVDGISTLTISMQNNGASLIKPKGGFTITDSAGKTIVDNKLALDTFVPGTSINYQVPLEQLTTPGTYKLHTTLDFGGSSPAVFDGSVVINSKPAAVATAGSSVVKSGGTSNNAAAQPGTAETTSSKVASMTNIQTKSDDNSGMLIGLLLGISGTLLLATVGMTVLVLRTRKRS